MSTPRRPVEQRPRAALLGLAIGDALGAPFEGRGRVDEAELDAWVVAGTPLRWTDDTHMAIGLARSLLANDGSVDLQHLGDTFAAGYGAEPWRGYGAGPPQIFAMASRGVPYQRAAASLFGGQGSFGNGAAMRATPAALAAKGDLDRTVDLAARQAQVTHTHPEAVDGAVAIAAATALLAHADPSRPPVDTLAELPSLMRTRTLTQAISGAITGAVDGAPLRAAQRAGNGVAARESVPAALAAFLTVPDDVVATVRTAVCLGGDTDTIAAMAASLAAAHLGPSALADELLGRLEAASELDELALALLRLPGDAPTSRHGLDTDQ
jgi:poly(ADP-ribose) glycohydrolase ARH3